MDKLQESIKRIQSHEVEWILDISEQELKNMLEEYTRNDMQLCYNNKYPELKNDINDKESRLIAVQLF